MFIPWFDTLCLANGCFDTLLEAPKVDFMDKFVSQLSHWDSGRNHIFFEYSDSPKGLLSIQKGIWATPSIWNIDLPGQSLRLGYDVPIPYMTSEQMHGVSDTMRSQKRDVLLSFRGNLLSSNIKSAAGPEVLKQMYMEGKLSNRPKASSPRSEISELHNGKDIIVGDRTVPQYDKNEFPEYQSLLLNSVFGLVPAGANPMSYRLTEVLACGAIPVILSDFISLPFSDVIHWPTIAVIVPEAQLREISTKLRKISAQKRLKM